MQDAGALGHASVVNRFVGPCVLVRPPNLAGVVSAEASAGRVLHAPVVYTYDVQKDRFVKLIILEFLCVKFSLV